MPAAARLWKDGARITAKEGNSRQHDDVTRLRPCLTGGRTGGCGATIRMRILTQIDALHYEGGYTAVTDFLREIRPPRQQGFERRFETAPGQQAHVDFAEFVVEFTAEPGVIRKVWLFSMVLDHSRWLWGRFCASQNLQSVLRCHIAAFAAMDGAPTEVLYDRMKTAGSRGPATPVPVSGN